MGETKVYVCFERGRGWYVGSSRRWSERWGYYERVEAALYRARSELVAQGGGLVCHYDVSGFLQGQERISAPAPLCPPRVRLSALARA